MLRSLRMVTLCVPDIVAAVRAYVDWLGYEIRSEGTVSERLAALWEAPLAAGSRTASLCSPASPETALRLIERPPTPGYAALMTYGWNANEILAEDPVALAARFAAGGSPFRVIGPPEALASNPAIIAMQATGPAGELNYFTRLPPGGGTFVKTPARCAVDRTFIVVLGGPSMSAMQTFYRDQMGLAVTPAYDSPVGVLQAAHGLPLDGTTPIALAPLPPAYAIELDRYPSSAVPRPRRRGDLPPGIAMVTFVADLTAAPHEGQALPWRVAPSPCDEPPYDGRWVGLLRGAAQEWLEIIAER